jgi:4-amino-4-deoxy-L-arabinose transferase-like glycosyltransferase
MRTQRLAVAAFLGCLLALAAAQVWCRPVDRDEGFWLYTSWRLAQGELPYRDFALPHLPLAPLYYAGAAKVFGPSLYALRALNVALLAVAAAALGLAVARRFERLAALLAVAFFASSSLTLTWLVPVKAYAPAVAALALAVAVWLWPGRDDRMSLARVAVVGLLLGAATLARLTLAVTLAAAALGIWFGPSSRPWRRAALVTASCLGFLALAPLVVYFRAAAGDAFAFNVWGIHRSLIIEQPADRLASALSLFWPPDPAILIATAFLALRAPNRRILAFPLAAGIFIILANLAPGTTQLQYFVPAAAAFAPAAGVGAAWLWRKKKAAALAVVGAAVVFGAARPAAKVALDRAHKELVGPAEVYAAARLLDEYTTPEGEIYTAWPGYAALARRKVIPGWELGYFTHRIGAMYAPLERRRYHLMTYGETAEVLRRGDAEFALDGLDTPDALKPTLARYYVKVASRRGVTLWRHKGAK